MFKTLNRHLAGLVSSFWPNDGAPGVEKLDLRLSRNGWISMAGSRGATIECLSGQAVVTQAGDAREHLVVRGSPYRAPASGRLCVQASTDAELRFSALLLGSKCL